MDMNKFRFTRLQNDILNFLCIRVGSKLSQREIALKLNVSPTAVSKALVDLIKEDLVVVKKVGKMNLNYVELNRESKNAVYFKKIENLKMIYLSGLLEDLEESFPGTTIVLFGSYSRGEDILSSDIDIAIMGCKEKEFKFYKKYEKILEREIIINFYPNFKEIHKNLKESILNGVLLYGSVEL